MDKAIRSTWIPFLLTLFDNLAIGVLLPIVPFLILYHGGDSFHVTLEISIFALGTLVVSAVAGYVSDLVSRKLLIVMIFLLAILANLGILGIGFVWGILVFRFFAGAAVAKEPVVIAFASENVPESEKAKTLTRLSTAKALGSALGPLLGGLVASNSMGEFAQFENVIAFSVGFLGLGLLLSVWLEEDFRNHDDEKPSISHSFIEAVQKNCVEIPDILYIRFAMGFVHAVVVAVTVLYVHRQFGWDVVETGYMYGAMVLILVATRLMIAPKLMTTFGSNTTCVLVMSLFIVCLAIVSQLPGLYVFGLIFALISVCNAILPPTLLLMMDELSDNNNRATRYGLGTSSFSLGVIVAGFLSGQLVIHSGIGMPYLLCSFVLGVSVVFHYIKRVR